MKMTVVISRYNEDISWVDQLNCDYIIYNKGDEIDRECIKLPNIGRESDTYLNFIISNYYEIKNPIVFLQGNPFGHCLNVIDLIKNYKSGITFLNSTQKPMISDGRGNPADPGLLVREWADKLGVKTENDEYAFCNGAQYIVPPNAITSKSLDYWKQLLVLHNTPTSPFGNEPNRSPWIIERLWYLIFNKKNDITF